MKLLKSLLTCCVVIGTNMIVVAQVNEVENIVDPAIIQEAKISYPYVVNVVDVRDNVPFTITVNDPEIVKARLKSIEKTMPMVYNESVEYYIYYFSQVRPNFTKTMMENAGLYFPAFEKILRENQMPEELKYLSILESGLNPRAVSRANAVGLWQFMSFTGKEYGLSINENVDERMHIEKSTEAACRYLKYLNRLFNDWDLALAAYNSGQGRIGRVIKKTGLTSYWDLHPHIPKETSKYVPQFIALAYLMNFGTEHGIKPEVLNFRPELENIYVESNVDLELLALLTNVSIDDIKKYNPQFKTTVLPVSRYGYEIALPSSVIPYFNENKVAILDSIGSKNRIKVSVEENPILLASNNNAVDNEGVIVIGKPVVPTTKTDLVEVSRKVKKVHQVKKGEMLSRIASKYSVSMDEIKKWNNKPSTKVIIGERLTVYVDQTSMVKSNSLAAKKSSDAVAQPAVYTVRRGDTLWNISQKYDGVTVNDIKKWNNITGNNVMVGQKIKIKS